MNRAETSLTVAELPESMPAQGGSHQSPEVRAVLSKWSKLNSAANRQKVDAGPNASTVSREREQLFNSGEGRTLANGDREYSGTLPDGGAYCYTLKTEESRRQIAVAECLARIADLEPKVAAITAEDAACKACENGSNACYNCTGTGKQDCWACNGGRIACKGKKRGKNKGCQGDACKVCSGATSFPCECAGSLRVRCGACEGRGTV